MMKAGPESARLGAEFRKHREAAGISQNRAAIIMAAAGHSTWFQTTVARIERGTRTITVDESITLYELIERFDAVAHLLGD